jgi:hypothetical protein
LALDDLLWPAGFDLHVVSIVGVDFLESGFLSMSEHLEFLAALLDFGQLHLFLVLLLQKDMQRLCLFVFLQEFLELLI